MEKNTFKLSHMLEISGDKAQELLNIVSLSDMAAITSAINTSDMKTIQQIYSKYQSKLNSNANPSEVEAFFTNLVDADQIPHDDAITQTADHFGITGEEVEAALPQKPAQESAPFIPDAKVAQAYNNVKEMMEGKPSRGVVTELNTWQRRMFYGLIPNNVAKIIQDTIDMTPIAVMQKHAEKMGYGEPAIKESEMSLAEMMEKIIESELANMQDGGEEEKPTMVANDTDNDSAVKEPVDEKTKALIKSITTRKF